MFSVIFDGTFEGFMCVIHAYYYDKITPNHIQREDEYQQTLDAEPYAVITDGGKAARVINGIRKKMSNEIAKRFFYSFLSGEDDIYMDMFRYIVLGFRVGETVNSYLQTDYVRRTLTLAKRVGSETHLLTGFCRFRETAQGAYYCAITPKNNVLCLLAEHFSSRFKNHAWVIHDKKRRQAAAYDGNEYVIAEVPAQASVNLAEGEEETQILWKTFFNTIAIKERASYKRQRQHVPLYFRGNMLEFDVTPAQPGRSRSDRNSEGIFTS